LIQVLEGPDAAGFLEPAYGIAPDHTGGQNMFGCASYLGHGMAEIPGNGPQSFAGQFGQQKSNDLVGTDDFKGKYLPGRGLPMKPFKKGRLVPAEMNHHRTKTGEPGDSVCRSANPFPDLQGGNRIR
jgi:hypothetical protein